MEKGKLYKNKMIKRITVFIVTFIMMIISIFSMGISYSGAQQRKSENYNELIQKANNPDLSQTEKVNLYLSAINIDDKITDAYLGLIELFLNSDNSTGAFEKSEAAVIIQLKAGLNKQNSKGYSETFYPFEDLKEYDPKGYANVCNEIGFAYWYDYEVESDRYSSAMTWFKEVGNEDNIAPIFYKIGECKSEIKKYANQARTEKKYKAYGKLWTEFNNLIEQSDALNDNDIKLLIYSEVVNTLSDEAQYILKSSDVTKQNVISVLDKIKNNCAQLDSSTQFDDIKNQIGTINENIENAKERIAAIN